MNFTETMKLFLDDLADFDPSLSCTDLVWNLIFPGNGSSWYHVRVVKYRETFYINRIDDETYGLELAPGKSVKVMEADGFSSRTIGRLVETIKMFLAIHDASFPVSIADPEGIRKRLLAQDNIGIIPAYITPHRANQHFRKDQDVFDVLHYDDLGRFKRKITPFITWEPLPILMLRNA